MITNKFQIASLWFLHLMLMINIFKRNSIRSRMLSGFLFLTLLIICVAAVSLFILNKTSEVASIHGRISQLQISTLSLIKTDNDFFDLETINNSYFETHESIFLNRRDSLKIRIQSGMDYIFHESKNGVIASLTVIDSLFNQYDIKFKLLENLLYAKGFKDFGLEGQMRLHAHKLEESQFKVSMLSVLSLRRNEKDFFLRHDLMYVTSLNKLADQLLKELKASPLNNQEAIFHLQEYQRYFNKLAAIQIQIGLSSNDGLRNELNLLSNELTSKYFDLSEYSYQASTQTQMQARIFYLFIVGGAVLFSLISGYWISKRLSSPIAKLSKLMNSVVSQKKIVKIDFTTDNAAEEINTLTRSFIHLMSQTNGHMKEIKSKSRLLKKRNQDLKKLNHELDSFIYSTAHDLRSPLTSLLGLLNIMNHENKQEDLKPYIQMMQSSIYRMEDFIGQIVGFSKNKRLDLVIEKIDLYSMISEIFDNHQFVEGANKIDRLIQVTDDIPCFSDRARVIILFNNLISNAIRYADLQKPNPFIKINIAVNEIEMVMEFSDNGIGIGEEHLDKVFNMFYRANVKSKGSGLGLFIFKETISKLNGSVNVESELSVGTKFVVRIPNYFSQQLIENEKNVTLLFA